MQEQPAAGASVPDLRVGRKWTWVFVGIGAVLVVAAIVIGIVIMRKQADPGGAACDHIAEMAKQDPKRWNRFVDALAATAEHLVHNRITGTSAEITSKEPDARCREAMAAFRDATTYRRYEELVDCVSQVQSFRDGRTCFEGF